MDQERQFPPFAAQAYSWMIPSYLGGLDSIVDHIPFINSDASQYVREVSFDSMIEGCRHLCLVLKLNFFQTFHFGLIFPDLETKMLG